MGSRTCPPSGPAGNGALESGGEIRAYGGDLDLTKIAFNLGGRVFLAALANGSVVSLPAEPGAFDPRPSPTGGGWFPSVNGGRPISPTTKAGGSTKRRLGCCRSFWDIATGRFPERTARLLFPYPEE